MEKKKLAFGYCRFSTTMQKDGDSIEIQKAEIEKYCAYKNYKLVDHYVDEAKSGKDIRRPSLQKMLEDLQPGMVIITKKLDRFSRSMSDTLKLIEQIKEKKCSIMFLDVDVDTSTPNGDFLLNITASYAQHERLTISNRVSDSMDYKSRNGTLQTKPRFGYKVIKNGKTTELVECEEEQQIIGLIKEMIEKDEQITVARITRNLNNNPDIKI
ncbi:MAG TPA: recombinase family protein, partial [Bacteroidales bacterium]|nr:recombinase family protein [Bacteroidales bacterium]